MQLLQNKKMITGYLVAIFFVLADRGLKFYAQNSLSGGKIEIIQGIFSFSLAENRNIAFSLPISGAGLNILIFLILGIILGLMIKNRRKWGIEGLFLFFIFLGGLSNLYDRVSYGYVIDYFDLSYFTVFNLADAMITFGVAALFFSNLRPEAGKPAKTSA